MEMFFPVQKKKTKNKMEVYVDRHKQETVYNDSLSRMCQRNDRLHTDMKSQCGFVSNDDLLLSAICLLSLASISDSSKLEAVGASGLF